MPSRWFLLSSSRSWRGTGARSSCPCGRRLHSEDANRRPPGSRAPKFKSRHSQTRASTLSHRVETLTHRAPTEFPNLNIKDKG